MSILETPLPVIPSLDDPLGPAPGGSRDPLNPYDAAIAEGFQQRIPPHSFAATS